MVSLSDWPAIALAVSVLLTGLGTYYARQQWKATKGRAGASSKAHKIVGADDHSSIVARQQVSGDRNLVVENLSITTSHAVAPAEAPHEAMPRESHDEKPAETPREAASDPARPRDLHLCDRGPYVVPAGEASTVELDVQPGDFVRGKILGDDSFAYAIVDEKNLVCLLNGQVFSTPHADEAEAQYYVEWQVEGAGPWFLVLNAFYKRYDREVEVFLRRE